MMMQPASFVAVPMPLMPKSEELMDIMCIALSDVMAGKKTAAQALNEAVERMRPVIVEIKRFRE